MNRKVLLIIFTLFISSLNLYAQKREVGKKDSQGKKTGLWKVYYEKSEKIKAQGNFLDGRKTGLWNYYTSKGKWNGSANYLDGKRSGLYQLFWLNKNGDQLPKEKGNYLNDKKFGEWITYSTNWKQSFIRIKGTYAKGGIKTGRWEEYKRNSDQLIKLETFNEQGVLNGSYEERKSNGELKVKGNMLSGKRNGSWILMKNNGNEKEKMSITYSNGIKNGLFEVRDDRSNTLIQKGNYQNDQKTGFWESRGSKNIAKGNYRADKKVGLWQYFKRSITTNHPTETAEYASSGTEYIMSLKRFDKNNKLVLDVSHNPSENGDKSFKQYFPDGTLRVKGQLKYEKKQGPWEEYYPNGSLGTLKNYSSGKLNGIAKVLYPNGIVKERINYVNGSIGNVLEMNDINGKKLDPGSLKNGNGTLIIYHDNGTLNKILNIVNGKVQN